MSYDPKNGKFIEITEGANKYGLIEVNPVPSEWVLQITWAGKNYGVIIPNLDSDWWQRHGIIPKARIVDEQLR